MAAPGHLLSNMVSLVLPMLLASLALSLTAVSAATTYTIKWAIDSDLGEFKHRAGFLEVGDVLDFKYNTKEHNLLEVTFADFLDCNSSAPVQKWTDGNTSIILSEPGVFYYIGGFPGHCQAKQYLIVRVMDKGAYAMTPSSIRPEVDDDGIRFGEESSSVAQWGNASSPFEDDIRVQLKPSALEWCDYGGCWPNDWWCWVYPIWCCSGC